MRGQSTHLREVRGGGWIGPPLSRDRWALISLGGGADALGMRTSGKGSRSEKRRQVFQAGRKQCCEDFLLDLRGGGEAGDICCSPPHEELWVSLAGRCDNDEDKGSCP